ncbi:MAG: hypothetical protein I3J02_03310 [Prevotella sp.]|nr:hypothetical protein [Prevotella sp.]
MTTEEIRQKLERFYDAETTRDEEEQLKSFFQSDAVPEDLKADQQLFCQLFAPEASVPEGLEDRLSHDIEMWNTVEKTTNRKARTVSLRWIAGMAASLLVLLSLGTWFNHRQTTTSSFASKQETYDNPKDAAGETARALTKFSMALNKGIDKMNNTETKD